MTIYNTVHVCLTRVPFVPMKPPLDYKSNATKKKASQVHLEEKCDLEKNIDPLLHCQTTHYHFTPPPRIRSLIEGYQPMLNRIWNTVNASKTLQFLLHHIMNWPLLLFSITPPIPTPPNKHDHSVHRLTSIDICYSKPM